jgi:lysozyme
MVPGISGRVDLDYAYQDFPSIIVNGGFNGYKASVKNPEPKPIPTLTIEEAAKKVIAGEFSNGGNRKKAIEALGLNYDAVQKRVNELLSASSPKADKCLLLCRLRRYPLRHCSKARPHPVSAPEA